MRRLKLFFYVVLGLYCSVAFADSTIVPPVIGTPLVYKCYGGIQQSGGIVEKGYDSCSNLYVGSTDPQCDTGYVAIGTRSWSKYWGPIKIGEGCALQCRPVISPASNCRWE